MTEEPITEETPAEEPALSPEVAAAPPPPPPLEAPPTPESLAEQVARESHEVVESQSPSDVVPNRPQVRDPATYAAAEEEEPAAEEAPAEEPPAEEPPAEGSV